MIQNIKLLLCLPALLLPTVVTGTAAERSLLAIHNAWRSSLKGVQIYGIALQELDSDAKACGLDRSALVNAVKSGLKDIPIQLTGEDLQLFNFFVDIATLHGGKQCTSTVSLRVSAFVDPTYAPLLAAEITPWSQRSILISASEDHGRVIADELAKQAAEFVSYFAINGHHYFNGKILQMALSTP